MKTGALVGGVLKDETIRRLEARNLNNTERANPQVIRNIVYFFNLKKTILDQSIQKTFCLNLRTEALVGGVLRDETIWRLEARSVKRCGTGETTIQVIASKQTS